MIITNAPKITQRKTIRNNGENGTEIYTSAISLPVGMKNLTIAGSTEEIIFDLSGSGLVTCLFFDPTGVTWTGAILKATIDGVYEEFTIPSMSGNYFKMIVHPEKGQSYGNEPIVFNSSINITLDNTADSDAVNVKYLYLLNP